MRNHLVSVATLVSTKLSGSVLHYLHEGREHSILYRNLVLKLQRAEQGVGARHIFVFDREYRSLLDTDGLMPIGPRVPQIALPPPGVGESLEGPYRAFGTFLRRRCPVHDGLRPDLSRRRGRRGRRGRDRSWVCGLHPRLRAVGANFCRVGCIAYRRGGVGIGADADAAYPKGWSRPRAKSAGATWTKR